MFLLQPTTIHNITTVYITTMPLYIMYTCTSFYYNQQQYTIDITAVYITTIPLYVIYTRTCFYYNQQYTISPQYISQKYLCIKYIFVHVSLTTNNNTQLKSHQYISQLVYNIYLYMFRYFCIFLIFGYNI
jgi:hypothetical protein